LGRIPQRNEKFLLDNLDVMIEEADETRVIAASVKLTADEKLKTDDA
jgi:Mg2+/Co2+ transporter CorC